MGGKPARTCLGALAHCRFQEAREFEDLSVLAITIYTGRRHQIRAHTRHVAHPCATDMRYTPREVVMEGAWLSSVAEQSAEILTPIPIASQPANWSRAE